MAALKSPGVHHSALMHDVRSANYHLLRGYYLQHTLGELDNRKAKGHKIGEQEKASWRSVTGMVPQDALVKLLECLVKLQESIFNN